eukprot:757326-Hanusia_phi.AAC.4
MLSGGRQPEEEEEEGGGSGRGAVVDESLGWRAKNGEGSAGRAAGGKHESGREAKVEEDEGVVEHGVHSYPEKWGSVMEIKGSGTGHMHFNLADMGGYYPHRCFEPKGQTGVSRQGVGGSGRRVVRHHSTGVGWTNLNFCSWGEGASGRWGGRITYQVGSERLGGDGLKFNKPVGWYEESLFE